MVLKERKDELTQLDWRRKRREVILLSSEGHFERRAINKHNVTHVYCQSKPRIQNRAVSDRAAFALVRSRLRVGASESTSPFIPPVSTNVRPFADERHPAAFPRSRGERLSRARERRRCSRRRGRSVARTLVLVDAH